MGRRKKEQFKFPFTDEDLEKNLERKESDGMYYTLAGEVVRMALEDLMFDPSKRRKKQAKLYLANKKIIDKFYEYAREIRHLREDKNIGTAFFKTPEALSAKIPYSHLGREANTLTVKKIKEMMSEFAEVTPEEIKENLMKAVISTKPLMNKKHKYYLKHKKVLEPYLVLTKTIEDALFNKETAKAYFKSKQFVLTGLDYEFLVNTWCENNGKPKPVNCRDLLILDKTIDTTVDITELSPEELAELRK